MLYSHVLGQGQSTSTTNHFRTLYHPHVNTFTLISLTSWRMRKLILDHVSWPLATLTDRWALANRCLHADTPPQIGPQAIQMRFKMSWMDTRLLSLTLWPIMSHFWGDFFCRFGGFSKIRLPNLFLHQKLHLHTKRLSSCTGMSVSNFFSNAQSTRRVIPGQKCKQYQLKHVTTKPVAV